MAAYKDGGAIVIVMRLGLGKVTERAILIKLTDSESIIRHLYILAILIKFTSKESLQLCYSAAN